MVHRIREDRYAHIDLREGSVTELHGYDIDTLRTSRP